MIVVFKTHATCGSFLIALLPTRGAPSGCFSAMLGYPMLLHPAAKVGGDLTFLSRVGPMQILFLHGWQSIPGGVKPSYLIQHGHKVINPKLPDDDFEQAVQIAQQEFDEHQPDVVVGSSRGGAVAMNIDSGDARLVLLCPAWKKFGAAETVRPSTVILHSKNDEVIPFADSIELVRNSGLPAYTLVEVGSDHRLADPESLDMMLTACLIGEGEPDAEEQDILEMEWEGLCYTGAIRWASEAKERDWVLVHGTVLSARVGKRIEHAWCECGELVVDLAMPVGLRIIEREQYYGAIKPEVSRRYSSGDALFLAIKNGHDGPWDQSEQLKK